MDQKKQITARIPHDLYENLMALEYPKLTDALIHVLSEYFVTEGNPEVTALESQVCELEAIIAAKELEHHKYVLSKEEHIETLKQQLDIVNNQLIGQLEIASDHFKELVTIHKGSLVLNQLNQKLIPAEPIPCESGGIIEKVRRKIGF